MIALVMYWDPHEEMQGLLGGPKRWLSIPLFVAQAFGATNLFLIGNPDIEHGYPVQHTEYNDLEDILSDNEGASVVALVGKCPEGVEPIPLTRYEHPEGDVLYIIGSDYGDIEFEKLHGYDVEYVHIDSPVDISHFWSVSVASIVLYDRWTKWQ